MSTLNHFIQTLKSDHFLFVAEISNNHLGDFDRYKKLIREAKAAGAHAAKFRHLVPSLFVCKLSLQTIGFNLVYGKGLPIGIYIRVLKYP